MFTAALFGLTRKKDLVGILSQSDYMSFLNTYKTDESLNFAMSSKISELGYTDEIYTTSWNESVFSALKMIRDKKLAAIPLVNDRNEIVGCLSATDVKSLAITSWPRVFDDAKDFLTNVHPASLAPITISENDTFSKVLDLMVTNKVHRVFVVDSDRHPIGVVTMTDVMRWLFMLLGK